MFASSSTVLLLCLVAGSLQLSIKEFVVPKLSEVGNDVELRCQYELSEGDTDAGLYVKWWWTPASSSSDDRKQIYQRINGHPAESIQHINTSKIVIKELDTIVLTNVTPLDSGSYECEVCNIDEVRKHDTLTVFTKGTGPQVNFSVIENESQKDAGKDLLIECEAEDVAPMPDVVIIVNGEKVNIIKSVQDDDQDGLFQVYANATVKMDDSEETEARCELFYDSNLGLEPYVDVETYVPQGLESTSTTEVPEVADEPEATPETMPISRDDGIQLHCPWTLLTTAAALATLRSIL